LNRFFRIKEGEWINRFFTKHPIISGYIFSILILYWIALGNISPIVISRYNIVVSVRNLFYALISAMVLSNVFLYNSIPSKKMNTYELFLNSLLPVLIYYLLKTIDYNMMIVTITVALIVCASVCIYWLQRYCNIKRIRMVYYARHIIAFNIVLLIIPSFLYYRYEKPAQEYVSRIENMSVVSELKEDELEKFKTKINNCKWEKLSVDEKGDLLLEFIENESVQLGIAPPMLCVENLDSESYKGLYNHSIKTITVNSYYLISENKEDCLNTVAHELYHAFQHSVIDIMSKLDENDYETNSYFLKGKTWIAARNSYAEDGKTSQGYRNNALEVDARDYAREVLAKKYELNNNE